MKLILVLLFSYLAVFTLGQLARLPLGITEINLYLTDIVVAGVVLGWLGWKLLRRTKIKWPSLLKPISLFLLVAVVSLIFNSPLLSGREVGVAILYLLRWVIYTGLYFVIYDVTHGSNNETINFERQIPNRLILAGTIVAIFGLLQYIFLPDTRFIENFGWDPHYFRLIGTFLDPGFLGMILVFTLILLTVKIWPSWNWKTAVVWIVVYIALALTYSRASYLAFLAGMGVIAFVKKAPKFLGIVLVIGVITVFLLPRPGGEGVRLERESTIRFRIVNWQQSLIISKDHPILGVGFNAYRYAQKRYGFLDDKNWQASHAGGGADSSLLFVLATTGILGLLAYLWLWFRIFRGLFTGPNLIVLSSVTALLIHSFFVNSLFYPWVMGWMWILLGSTELKD